MPAGTPLVFIDRLTYDGGDHPVDYEHLYVRADRFRYGLRLEGDGRARETEPQ